MSKGNLSCMFIESHCLNILLLKELGSVFKSMGVKASEQQLQVKVCIMNAEG